MYKVGNLTFPSREYYERLIETNLVKEYDFSPIMREKHSKEIEEWRNRGKDIIEEWQRKGIVNEK